VIPWCEAHGVAVVAYSPFGHNDFPNPRSEAGRVLQKIAQAHDATARQVALSFLARRASVFAIPKASSAANSSSNTACSTPWSPANSSNPISRGRWSSWGQLLAPSC